MHQTRFFRCVALLIACCLPYAPVAAQAELPQAINIPPGDLVTGLDTLARQSGAEFVYSASQLHGLKTHGAVGALTVEQALGALVEGSGATIRRDSSGAILVEPGRPPVPSGGSPPRAAAGTGETAPQRQFETITVTGTNIRGLQNSASPLLVLDRQYIGSTGYASLGQLVDSLPQNFGGGAGQDTLGIDGSVGNNGFGDAANLRGLGPGATLVLLNGQRLAPGGNSGQFVDISMIPLAAIERVEVLTDGASAIYGADAVGGVINVITREDYQGAETTLRYGAASDGGAAEREATQSYATSWGSGSAMAVLDWYRRDALLARDRDFASANDPSATLLPDQERKSLYASANQDINPYLSLFGNLLYTRRDSEFRQVIGTADSAVHDRQTARNEDLSGSFGLRVNTDGSWNGEIVASYSRYALDSLLDRDGDLTPTTVDTDSTSLDARVNGTLATLPGGDMSVALGAAYRRENVNTIFDDVLPERTVRVAFGEIYVPIVEEANRLPGIEALDIDLAARYEDFSDFGSKVTPKYGIRWSPVLGLTLRGTYGKSFKAPTLAQLASGTEQFLAFIPSDFGLDFAGDPLILARTQKARPDLEAEHSTNRTLGFEFKPAWAPFNFSLTWYDIDFTGRVGDPSDAFFTDPDALGPLVVHNPNPAFVSDLLANATSVLDLTGGLLAPDTVGLFADLALTNIAADRQSGYDFKFDLPLQNDWGAFDASVQGTWITRFDRKIAPEAPASDALNVLYGPVDLRLRGGLSWSRAALSTALFVNYVDGYRVSAAPDSPAIGSWTTLDLHVAYDLDAAGDSLRHGMRLAVNVQNVFNRAPPFVNSPSFINGNTGYDPNNADPLGRFISIVVSKTW